MKPSGTGTVRGELDFPPREVIDVNFWGRFLGRIAIVLLLVPSAFAYEAPQFILVALVVAGSAGALSMQTLP